MQAFSMIIRIISIPHIPHELIPVRNLSEVAIEQRVIVAVVPVTASTGVSHQAAKAIVISIAIPDGRTLRRHPIDARCR